MSSVVIAITVTTLILGVLALLAGDIIRRELRFRATSFIADTTLNLTDECPSHSGSFDSSGDTMKKLYLALASALIIGGCAAGGGSIAPEKQTGVFGQEKDKVSVTTAEAFKGKKDVVIGSFKVGFIEYKRASETAGGGMFSDNAAATTRVKANLGGAPMATTCWIAPS